MITYHKFGLTLCKTDNSEEATTLLKKALQLSEKVGDSRVTHQIRQEIQDLE
jgi:hypothetical protein